MLHLIFGDRVSAEVGQPPFPEFRYTRPGSISRRRSPWSTTATPPPKNLVVCCDGTGNEISENISDVLKLYRCLRKTDRTQPRRKVLCDPGDRPGDGHP
ncbi:hypothetical protein BROWWM01_15360 [Bradyrhizobium ottawaense]